MQSLEDKLACEKYLASEGLNWTSIRPVYIYGSLDFNFSEKDNEDNDFLTFRLWQTKTLQVATLFQNERVPHVTCP